ncbi:MAG: hypothetical protein IPJ53_14990 [Saprospiraceae bacterium]|nr:hypothetical protein [Candidatus Vicinibacter affinis]
MWEWKSRKQINTVEWNVVLQESFESKIEWYSEYLDISCDHWGAFFNKQNNQRIPVAYNRKYFGLAKVYRQDFCQQLNIIGRNIPSESDWMSWKSALEKRFYFGAVQTPFFFEGAKERTNLILDLDSYTQNGINGFSSHHKRSIEKTTSSYFYFDYSVSVDELKSWLDVHAKEFSYLKKFNLIRFKRLLNWLISNGSGWLLGVRSADHELLCIGVFTDDGSRISYLISFNSEAGKKQKAMYALFDQLIKKYSATHKILDFEGSDIPGVRRFFEGFGPARIPYYEHSWSLFS